MNKTNRNGNGNINSNASLGNSTPLLQEKPRALEDQWTDVHGVKEADKLFGRINMEDDQPNYVGSTHWAAILDNVGHSLPSFVNL